MQRNRAKRVIREAYRVIDKNYGVKRGWLIVIVPKTTCTVCSMKECLRDFTYCLRSLDMLMSEEAQEKREESDGEAASLPETNTDAKAL